LGPVLSGQRTADKALDEFISEYRTVELEAVIDALVAHLGGGPELWPEPGELCSWDEIRRMADGGVEMGAHTLWHTVLTLEDTDAVEREVRDSKAWIEREVGRPVKDFAYCNGWYSEEVIRILAKHGFRSGVTTEDLPNRLAGDPFTLKRKVLWENFSLGALGEYSPALTGCHLDDVFGALGASRPVLGKRPQRVVEPELARFFARERSWVGTE
jgi:hypothetical protein